MPTRAPKRPSSPSSIGRQGLTSRADDPEHEELLVAIKRSLPALLRDVLQTPRQLNEAIDTCRSDWRLAIEDLIKERGIPPEQAAIWRSVPEIQFQDPLNLKEASIRFGIDLCSSIDGRGNRRSPVSMFTADYEANCQVLRWDVTFRGGVFAEMPEGPIEQAREALEIDQLMNDQAMYGCVFPSSITVGRAADDMAKLRLAFDTMTAEESGRDLGRPIQFVTNSRRTFDLLIDQYDGVLFNAVGEVVEFDLGDAYRYVESRAE